MPKSIYSYINNEPSSPSSSYQESSGSEWEPEVVMLDLVTPPPSPNTYPEDIGEDGKPYVNLLTPPGTPTRENQEQVSAPTPELHWTGTEWYWDPSPFPPPSPEPHEERFAHLFQLPEFEYRSWMEGLTEELVKDWIAYVSVY